MNPRRVALAVGVLAFGVGVAVSVAPWLVPVSLDRALASVVGGLALLQAVRVVQGRRNGTLDEADTPDPERSATTPSPGDELESVLEEFLDGRHRYFPRSRIREGLETAAVAVLTQYGSYSEAEATERLANGTWTADPYAAAFLGNEGVSGPSLRTRIRDRIRGESALEQQVRHTVDAIATAAGLTLPDGERGSGLRHRITRLVGIGGDTESTGFTTSTDHDESTELTVSRPSHATGHWRGVSVVTLVAVGVGILATEAVVVLAGVVGVGFAAYARSSVLAPGAVSVDRSLADERPDPGDEVPVTVTVTNESDRPLADLRVVDGVPEALAVAEGSPRLGTAVRPGGTVSFEYSVTARRGAHSFRPALVVARDLAGAVEREVLCRAETTLTCVPPLRATTEPVPLREQATQYVGQVETSTGGEGLEFYGTREYQPGDPISRLDWNHRARTGEFTTVEYRRERAATVVVVVDSRDEAYRSPAPEPPHAVDRAVDAAGQLFVALADAGNQVGIAAVGSESCWLAPSAGVAHRAAARDLLATHPALAPVPAEHGSLPVRWGNLMRKRLSPGTQVLFLTPLCDAYGSRLVRQFEAAGYPVTVVSPDPTTDRTAGHRLARVARTLRLTMLRSRGIPVVDVPWNSSIDVALARYAEHRR